jgi:tripeptidyl-peptidase-1
MVTTNKGKAPLGWLNPLFYANPTAFNDITSGDNPGCHTQGFQAAVGWDPVTGLGSMNYANWAVIVSKLP